MTDHYLLHLSPQKARYLATALVAGVVLNRFTATVDESAPLVRVVDKDMARVLIDLALAGSHTDNVPIDEYIDKMDTFVRAELKRLTDWIVSVEQDAQAIPPEQPSPDGDTTQGE